MGTFAWIFISSWFTSSFIVLIIGFIYKWKTGGPSWTSTWWKNIDGFFYLFLGGYISFFIVVFSLVDDYRTRKEARRIEAPWYLLKEFGGKI